MQIDHDFVTTNGIRLHVASAGPADGPLLLLLHGFPEYWRGWQHVVEPLAAAGWRVWMPDQRGYNLSDKPDGIAAYSLDTLADDVLGLIESAGETTAVVAGHDWGGAVAWWLANRNPQSVRRLIIFNAPHHAVFERRLRTDWRQRLSSSYMLFFQLPWWPEAMIRAQKGARTAALLQRTARRGAFSKEELAEYRRTWLMPGAATGMLNWYRAIVRARPKPLPSPIIEVPTAVIWGVGDSFLAKSMAPASVELCHDGRLHFVEDATHWILHEQPEQVAALMLEFLD